MSVRRDVAFRTGKKRKIKKESKEKHEQKEYVYKTEEKDRTALETFSGDQFTLSTQLIKPSYLVEPPTPPSPTQHNSLFTSLPLYPEQKNTRFRSHVYF